MSRCVIIASSSINNVDFVRSVLKDDDFFIFCDAGLRHKEALCVMPNLIVGDFDSADNPNLDVETIVLPCEKDDTDTFYAVKEGVKRGFTDFLLLGVVGRRLDHTLGNISILLYLHKMGFSAQIIDDYSIMEIADENEREIKPIYPYFSLMNVSGDVSGVTIKNAKYELDNADITCDYQYALSNETIDDKTASVSVKNGKMLLIKLLSRNC